jgi:hypothetical protein
MSIIPTTDTQKLFFIFLCYNLEVWSVLQLCYMAKTKPVGVRLYEDAAQLRDHRPKPIPQELDALHMRVHQALLKDCKPIRRY